MSEHVLGWPLLPSQLPLHVCGSGPDLTHAPWAYLSPHPKRHFVQLTAEDSYRAYFGTGRHSLSLKIAHSHGNLGRHLTHASLGPLEYTSETASRSVQSFLHSSPQIPLYFTIGRPLKIAPSYGDLDPHYNTQFLGPPEFTTQMGSRSLQPVLLGSRS